MKRSGLNTFIRGKAATTITTAFGGGGFATHAQGHFYLVIYTFSTCAKFNKEYNNYS